MLQFTVIQFINWEAKRINFSSYQYIVRPVCPDVNLQVVCVRKPLIIRNSGCLVKLRVFFPFLSTETLYRPWRWRRLWWWVFTVECGNPYCLLVSWAQSMDNGWNDLLMVRAVTATRTRSRTTCDSRDGGGERKGWGLGEGEGCGVGRGVWGGRGSDRLLV